MQYIKIPKKEKRKKTTINVIGIVANLQKIENPKKKIRAKNNSQLVNIKKLRQ